MGMLYYAGILGGGGGGEGRMSRRDTCPFPARKDSHRLNCAMPI